MGNNHAAWSVVLLPGEKHRSQPSRCLFTFQGLKVDSFSRSQKPAECLYYNRCCIPGVPSHAKGLQHMFHQNFSQTPGKMWAARCSYVAQLKDPDTFDRHMLQVQDGQKAMSKCQGTDRSAAEHWVSHPAPCDLDTNVDYTALQIVLDPPKGPTTPSHTKELKKAPHFEVTAYHWTRDCEGWGETLSRRLAQYRVLYGTEPAADWWGWIFFTPSWAPTLGDQAPLKHRSLKTCSQGQKTEHQAAAFTLWNILKQELVLTLMWVAEWLSSLDILTLLPFSTLSSYLCQQKSGVWNCVLLVLSVLSMFATSVVIWICCFSDTIRRVACVKHPVIIIFKTWFQGDLVPWSNALWSLTLQVTRIFTGVRAANPRRGTGVLSKVFRPKLSTDSLANIGPLLWPFLGFYIASPTAVGIQSDIEPACLSLKVQRFRPFPKLEPPFMGIRLCTSFPQRVPPTIGA